jgi:hypothetical protein
VAVGLLLAVVIAYLGLLARNAAKSYDYIGRPTATRDTIAIEADGKVTAVPDIARLSIGVQTEKKTVGTAQKENTAKMNAIIDKLKALNVERADIKTTSYTIYPAYDWVDGRQIDRGYVVNQSVDVKIRDLDSVGQVLAAVAELGANQVSGVNFTIDDPEELQQQARLKGLEAAKKKAEALASAAGVKLGKIVGFSEGVSQTPYPYMAYGKGGGVAMEAAAPIAEPGTQDVIVHVSVVYEIIP